jgi:hypothetical protein
VLALSSPKAIRNMVACLELIIFCCIVLKIWPGIKNGLAVYPGMVQQVL